MAISGGNVEVGPTGLLTGGGMVANSGSLQLDPGDTSGGATSGSGALSHGTVGLGSYVQWTSGVLSIGISLDGGYTPLTVTGTADLSGTLTLPGYVPVVGDSFTVVVAGGISNEFLYVPEGMDQTVTAITDTVTQD